VSKLVGHGSGRISSTTPSTTLRIQIGQVFDRVLITTGPIPGHLHEGVPNTQSCRAASRIHTARVSVSSNRFGDKRCVVVPTLRLLVRRPRFIPSKEGLNSAAI